MGDHPKASGPDFKKGIASTELKDVLVGQADGESVLLTRQPQGLYAVGATCTHYSANLADGLITDHGTLRCPWHHACFDLASGEALEGPARCCWPPARARRSRSSQVKAPPSSCCAPRVTCVRSSPRRRR